MAEPISRLDKWLFCARFARTRSLAADWVEKGKIRLNAQRVSKPGQRLRVGDVLTFTKADTVYVIEVVSLAERRLGAREAATLYKHCGPEAQD